MRLSPATFAPTTAITKYRRCAQLTTRSFTVSRGMVAIYCTLEISHRSTNDNDNDGTNRECIWLPANKPGVLSRHRKELLDRYPKAEAANEQLKKEVEERKSCSMLFT